VNPGDVEATHRAAELLADAWGPALECAHRLGYETGYARGWLEGRNEEREAWNKIIGCYRDTTAQPTFAELQARRAVQARPPPSVPDTPPKTSGPAGQAAGPPAERTPSS
jgi:hypothetical protein